MNFENLSSEPDKRFILCVEDLQNAFYYINKKYAEKHRQRKRDMSYFQWLHLGN